MKYEMLYHPTRIEKTLDSAGRVFVTKEIRVGEVVTTALEFHAAQ
jgi:hypothetical protein